MDKLTMRKAIVRSIREVPVQTGASASLTINGIPRISQETLKRGVLGRWQRGRRTWDPRSASHLLCRGIVGVPPAVGVGSMRR
jgi:hypothetical protein